MPREARKKSETGIYHVVQRGINRQRIFREDEDRYRFVEIMARYKRRGGYRLMAYCLMNNHIHLLLQERDEAVGQVMKRISSGYVYWYNNKYRRCGHLFQERFKSEAVESEAYFLTVLRYIHRNPVKAGLVSDVSGYEWSSYCEYIGGNRIIDAEVALGMLGTTEVEALAYFVRYSAAENDDQCLEIEGGRKRVGDERLRKIIKRELGMENMLLSQAGSEAQARIVRKLKQIEGVTIRQIAQVTGISPTSVWRT